MSRYSDYDDYDEDDANFRYAAWQRNARLALSGKRGRKMLAELREALMALPEKRLIRDALCTVGAEKRKAALLAQAERDKVRLDEQFAAKYGPAELDASLAEQFAEIAASQGEGVCGVGAWLWYRKVKAGADPAEAFDSLPLVFDGDGEDSLHGTAGLAKQAGAAFTLAWELAYKNDETFASKTPEERHAAFVAWIDEQLAGLPAAS
jgi:hypothetical protein